MKIGTYISLLALPLLVNSCATVVNGTTQEVVVKSNVQGARIYINGIDRGVSPNLVTLERSESYTLEMRAPGFATHREKLESSMSGWFAGNLILGGIIGMAIDLCAGSCWAFDDVNVTLIPQNGAGSTNVSHTNQSSTNTTSNNVVKAPKKTGGTGARSSKPMDGFFDTVLGDN
ncbi:MAG: PEGA domain-containing protein [Akkermansiaceae bacterium]|nr:PEGA domain-containing protein [Akkermansiaceae bacterium]